SARIPGRRRDQQVLEQLPHARVEPCGDPERPRQVRRARGRRQRVVAAPEVAELREINRKRPAPGGGEEAGGRQAIEGGDEARKWSAALRANAPKRPASGRSKPTRPSAVADAGAGPASTISSWIPCALDARTRPS